MINVSNLTKVERCMMKKIILTMMSLLIMVTAANAQVMWMADKNHTEIQFKVKHLVISTVTGLFNEYDVKFSSPKADDFQDSKLEVTLKTASINTHNKMRDDDLKSDNFLNAAKYPEIKFVSKSFKKKSGNKYEVKGNLTIRDVTREVTLIAEHTGSAQMKAPMGPMKGTNMNIVAFNVTGEIDRFDYNVKWGMMTEAGGLVVSRTIKFDFNLEFASPAMNN